MELHRLGELRSHAYHATIAARLHEDPALIERARSRVLEWQRQGHLHPRLAGAWLELLGLAPAELAGQLVREDEWMVRLRSVSPFAGELAPRDRWRLWRQVKDE